MANVLLFLVGYILGIVSCAIFAALLLLHRPQSIAPTMRRKYRDRLPEVRAEPPPMPECRVARDAEVGGIAYRFLGTTGFEE